MTTLKETIKKIPVIGTLARFARVTLKKTLFPGSQQYWERHYASGGSSGEGSYGIFAEFKAGILNDFVRENAVQSVIEFGCGDGNQLSLAHYPKYIGLDVSPSALKLCIQRFHADTSKSFYLYDMACFVDNAHLFRADLAMSLDVIFHLIEDDVFDRYMRNLFNAANKFVVIYSSNTDQTSALEAAHYKNRQFSAWIDQHQPGWTLIKHIPNKYPYTGDANTGSQADFYIYAPVGA